MRILRLTGLCGLGALLAGCSGMVVLHPAGDVALRERDLVIASTLLMLLIIVPVIVATLTFAWRYRASNAAANYDPDFHHSTQLEVLIWTAPLLIIIALGALTWISTHTLDPFRPLSRIDASRPVASEVRPLRVQVVALDWKWLFFYPEQGIATVNELAAPIDRPLSFTITSATVMNSFFVPALAGQIYAMAGMQTQLHAVANRPGTYDGFSANYSGAGFSRMNFKFHALSTEDFAGWVDKAKASGTALDQARYLDLEKPSEGEPVRYFASVQEGLYDAILNMCAVPGKMCMNEMMHIDAQGGAGKESGENREKLLYDTHRLEEGVEQPGATFPATGRPARSQTKPEGTKPDANGPAATEPKTQPDAGEGQAMPGMDHAMPGMQHDTPAPAQLQKN